MKEFAFQSVKVKTAGKTPLDNCSMCMMHTIFIQKEELRPSF